MNVEGEQMKLSGKYKVSRSSGQRKALAIVKKQAAHSAKEEFGAELDLHVTKSKQPASERTAWH